MGVLEVVAVFQAVTEQPVGADMREPDQAEGQGQGPALPPAETHHSGRQDGAVRGSQRRGVPVTVPFARAAAAGVTLLVAVISASRCESGNAR